jgi:uncharacterized membrane protein
VRTRAYDRGEIEFSRVLAFSDGVFAIAVTLLVVGIGVPTVRESQLGDALRDLRPEIISFFISFIVIGNYWLAHHRFVAQLARITTTLMTQTSSTWLRSLSCPSRPRSSASTTTRR